MATWFNKETAAYFFEKGADIIDNGKAKNFYKCRCALLFGRECVSKINSYSVINGAGFTNLKNHLRDCIPDYEAQFNARDEVILDIRNHIKVDHVTQKIFSWIEWIIVENLPFNFVEKVMSRKNSKMEPISKYTLLKYMDQLGYECEEVLKNILPDRFGISFDGWAFNKSLRNICELVLPTKEMC